MNKNTFKRYELKYIITTSQYDEICKAAARHMTPDSYCKSNGEQQSSYMIYNIYFDTPNHAVIRRSLEKPYFKEKLRMRSYKTQITNMDMVFLELKKKVDGVVTKRRAQLRYNDALYFVTTGKIPDSNNFQDRQVLAEIEDFLRRYNVQPTAFISYERTAFFGINEPDFRISFDKSIRTRRDNVSLKYANFGSDLLPNGNILMEVKCDGAMPLWLTKILSANKIYKCSFSKYGNEYKAFTKKQAANAA